MQIDHLSATAINMYLRCPQQYYFRYCEGMKSPPGAALTLGLSFHRGTAKNYEQKIETHEDLPIDDVLDVFSTQFDAGAHDTVWVENEKPGDIKDSGIVTLKEYQRVLAPTVQPVAVEQKFNLSFKKKDYKFVGYVDLVDDQDVIIETKTTGKKPAEPKFDHTLQLTAYATGYRATKKKKETGVRIDYAVNKAKPEVVSYPLEIGDGQIEFLWKLVARVAHGIESELWIPNRGSFLCSHRWCGYADRCEALLGGTVRD